MAQIYDACNIKSGGFENQLKRIENDVLASNWQRILSLGRLIQNGCQSVLDQNFSSDQLTIESLEFNTFIQIFTCASNAEIFSLNEEIHSLLIYKLLILDLYT